MVSLTTFKPNAWCLACIELLDLGARVSSAGSQVQRAEPGVMECAVRSRALGADTESRQQVYAGNDAIVSGRDIYINADKEQIAPFLVVDQEFLGHERGKD